MTQVLPERNFSSREDTLHKNTDLGVDTGVPLTTSDVIILGEDFYENHKIPYHREPGFIGPLNATNESRALLLRRAENLAEIGVMNFEEYEAYRAHLVAQAHEGVADGTLRLGEEYPNLSIDEQVDAFVKNSVSRFIKSRQDVLSEIKATREALNLASKGPEKVLQKENLELKESVQKQASRILKVRDMLVDRGASEEFMREFDYTTKLMTKPDQELYEREMQLDPEHETAPLVDTGSINLFEKFKAVLSPSFGRKALQSIGILSPKSGEVSVVKTTTPENVQK